MDLEDEKDQQIKAQRNRIAELEAENKQLRESDELLRYITSIPNLAGYVKDKHGRYKKLFGQFSQHQKYQIPKSDMLDKTAIEICKEHHRHTRGYLPKRIKMKVLGKDEISLKIDYQNGILSFLYLLGDQWNTLLQERLPQSGSLKVGAAALINNEDIGKLNLHYKDLRLWSKEKLTSNWQSLTHPVYLPKMQQKQKQKQKRKRARTHITEESAGLRVQLWPGEEDQNLLFYKTVKEKFHLTVRPKIVDYSSEYFKSRLGLSVAEEDFRIIWSLLWSPVSNEIAIYKMLPHDLTGELEKAKNLHEQDMAIARYQASFSEYLKEIVIFKKQISLPGGKGMLSLTVNDSFRALVDNYFDQALVVFDLENRIKIFNAKALEVLASHRDALMNKDFFHFYQPHRDKPELFWSRLNQLKMEAGHFLSENPVAYVTAEGKKYQLQEKYVSWYNEDLARVDRIICYLTEVQVPEVTGSVQLSQAFANTPNLSLKDYRVKKILEYIHNNYTEDIRWPEILKNFSIHYETGLKIFKKHIGLGLQSYLAEYRLRQAAAQLIQSEQSILEIAAHNGFKSQQYFSNAFTRFFGLSPKAYRQRNKEE